MRRLFVLASILIVGCAREGAVSTRAADGAPPSVSAVARPQSASVVPPVVAAAQRPSGDRVALKLLRLSTPEEKVRWERVVDALWNTPLGQLYSEYLYSPTADHSDLPLWARMVAERMFREPNHLTVRIAALQVLTEDLYVREKLNVDVGDRVLILQGHIDQKRMIYSQSAQLNATHLGAPFVLAAIPYGSAAVRKELGAMWKNTGRMIGKEFLGRKVEPLERIRLGRMVTNFEDDFSIRQSAEFIGLTLVPVQTGLWLYNDWYFASKWAPVDQVQLLGLDQLVKAMEDPDELRLMSDLQLPKAKRTKSN